MSCTNLTSREIEYLTRILRLSPYADPVAYTTRVTALLASSLLPSRLKRPCRLSTLFNNRSKIADLNPLCALHRRLNAVTVHSLFKRLALEVGPNLNSLALRRQLLNAEQREIVVRLRELHALWLPAEEAFTTFGVPPPVGKWRFVHRGCEACILAHVGGAQDALLDLRTVLLSRTRTRLHIGDVEAPTLLRFVEAWLKGLEVREAVLQRNWQDAQVLKGVRKGVRKQRVKERNRGSGTLEPERKEEERVTDVREVPDLENAAAAAAASGLGGETSGSDVENDIIDHYVALTSAVRLSSLSTQPGTTLVNGARSDISGTTRVPSTHANRPAEDQARSYQDLLATLPRQGVSAWDLGSVAEGEKRRTGGTVHWGLSFL
jgi:hypothetical protein